MLYFKEKVIAPILEVTETQGKEIILSFKLDI
jgi:hypothetical protein